MRMCVFEMDVRSVTDGDGFIILSDDDGLDWFEKGIGAKWDYRRIGTLGPEAHDDSSMKVLNRIWKRTPMALEHEPDPRHAEIIIAETGVMNARPVETPSPEKPQVEPGPGGDVLCAASESKAFRSLRARTGYLAQDRHEMKNSDKDMSRFMNAPAVRAVKRAKRVVRYLNGETKTGASVCVGRRSCR